MSEALAVVGHNRPTPQDIASDVIQRLGSWLAEHPVIQSREDAVEGARLSALASKALADIDDERKAKVKPLNDQVGAINMDYRVATLPLRSVLATLDERVTSFAREEELRKKLAAAEASRLAREAESRAREAAERARAAEENAAAGELGVDIASAATEEARASADAARAQRDAQRAGRDITVRLPTGLGRARSLRSTETLTVTDAAAAVNEIGLTPEISAALTSAARAFRKLKGRLPAGIATATERHI